MGEQLSMLDTMFLELEQADESAHMHIGAGLIFDPLPEGGTPDITSSNAVLGSGGPRAIQLGLKFIF